MRPLDQSDIFQIEITQRCFLKCGNCTHGVGAYEHPEEMSVETFERAIDSMEGYPGLIGLIGGEPTTHSQFEEICRIFRKKWGGPAAVARNPIRDFDAFVKERLMDRRSRRGLWTSLGAGFYRHYEIIGDTFDHLCVNDHRNPGLHQALFITRKELGIPDDEWEKLRSGCWVASTWSGSITVLGKGYFCEVGGMIDSVFNGGANGWPLEKGWWKRQPKDYGAQLDLCESCGLALPGPAIEGRKDKTILTPLSLDRLKKVNAPMVRKGDYVVYDPAAPEQSAEYKEAVNAEGRSVDTKDSYMPTACNRVSPDNASVRPKKVTAVVVAVGERAITALSKTIRHNAALVDEVIVVCIRAERQKVAIAVHGMAEIISLRNVTIVDSDRCFEDGDAFNKGKAINDGLAAIQNPDWVLLSDVDCLWSDNLRRFTTEFALNPGVLLGSGREEIRDDLPVSTGN